MQLKKCHEKCFQSTFSSLIGITAFCFTFYTIVVVYETCEKVSFYGLRLKPLHSGMKLIKLTSKLLSALLVSSRADFAFRSMSLGCR